MSIPLPTVEARFVQVAIDEFRYLGRTSFLERYGLPKSREYMLRDSQRGDLFDVLAIWMAACKHQGLASADGVLPVSYENETETAEHLATLGFEVVRIGQAWSDEEVALTVADYFQMLRLEAQGQRYNKSQHNEVLRQQLRARSKASVEMKHQNISAILDLAGLPYIPGYKPRYNFQKELQAAVLKFLQANSPSVTRIVDYIQESTRPGDVRFVGALIDAPSPEYVPTPAKRIRTPRKMDYAQRDERNRELGKSGEAWTIDYERFRLSELGRNDLAQKIDWLSERLGDGSGYDIKSYEDHGVARFIEVKTTNLGSKSTFIVSRNELEFSQEVEDAFCLYRLFNFSTDPGLYVLRGALPQHVTLEPLDYRARLRQALG